MAGLGRERPVVETNLAGTPPSGQGQGILGKTAYLIGY